MNLPPLSPEDREELRRRYYAMQERQAAREANPPDPASLARSLPDAGEMMTPERFAMAGDEMEIYSATENEHWRAVRLLDKHVLEFCQSRGIISGDQYTAGLQFYSDWYMSGLGNNGTIDPCRVVVDGGAMEHFSEMALDALNRYNAALKALLPPLSTCLVDLLISEESLESWGRRHHGHKSPKLAKLAAQTILKAALAALDYHYHGRRHTRTRASHAPGYRPTIHADTAGD